VHVDDLQSPCIALTVRGNRRLKDDRPRSNVDNRERMRVAVRIDTNDVVQLICEHP
jgi:hypothetical protein